MSKVFSFRLNDDNPREAQAREEIKAWVKEGYSLRYIITEALLIDFDNKTRAFNVEFEKDDKRWNQRIRQIPNIAWSEEEQ